MSGNHEDQIDWDYARQLSLEPSGFGDSRVELWAKLLNAQPNVPVPNDSETNPAHADERQIKLDTNRSFVLYPVDTPTGKDKATLQQELNELIVSIFRRRPRLSYFQGYHDIITVLYLTLPPDLHLSCAEKFSLHRLRDSMGKTLDPAIALLKVLRNLLRLADNEYGQLLEETSPLPYPLLSSILTLLAHDMPSLPLIQHLFDYLLCREPIMVVYVCAAIVLTRKPRVMKLLEEEGDDGLGMIHSVLGGLEDIHPPEGAVINTSQDGLSLFEDTWSDRDKVKTRTDHRELPPEDIPLPLSDDEDDTASIPDPTDFGTSSPFPTSTKSQQTPAPSSSSPTPSADEYPQIPLTQILTLSTSLYESYPPTQPSLHLSSIMGPQSVVFTWSEDPSELPDDDEAEKMVDHPELVVLPYVEDEEEFRTFKENDQPPSNARKQRIQVSRGTVLASAVLVLGVAIAVYGSQQQGGSRRADWALLGGWIGGILY